MVIAQLSTVHCQRIGRARGHRPYHRSTEGGHGGTAPTTGQLSTLDCQLSTIN
ncbi:MAG: hypothetical protein HC786_14140 [Richelia sp. CSU_2_1]|nr:hypothetical protein [Microcoleus sp. SU_5_6]NJR23210.1 hypothetical protein [Richelia sp. CSU_2_1]